MKTKSNQGISIIVPMYNAAETIIELLNSIIYNNSPIEYEILLIDDCSSDDTIKIVTPYLSDNVRLILNDQNLGTAGSRNNGIKNSKFNYICFFDADDYIIGNIFFELEKINFGNYDILYFDSCIDREKCVSFTKEDKRNILKTGSVCNKVYSKHIIPNFDQNLSFEDVDFLYNLSEFTKYVRLNNVQYNIRRSNNLNSKMALFNQLNYMEMYDKISINYKKFEEYKKLYFQESFMYVALNNKNLSVSNRIKIFKEVVQKIIGNKFKLFLNLYVLKSKGR